MATPSAMPSTVAHGASPQEAFPFYIPDGKADDIAGSQADGSHLEQSSATPSFQPTRSSSMEVKRGEESNKKVREARE